MLTAEREAEIRLSVVVYDELRRYDEPTLYVRELLAELDATRKQLEFLRACCVASEEEKLARARDCGPRNVFAQRTMEGFYDRVTGAAMGGE